MYATIDIETTGLNRYKDKITFIGVGLAPDVDSPITKGYIFNMNSKTGLERFKALVARMKSEKMITVFQNG